MKKYKFGFEYRGFIVFVLAMIPTIVWMVWPPELNPLIVMKAPYAWVDMVMMASQMIMFAMIIVLIRLKSDHEKNNKLLIVAAITCLIIYYFLWVGYYMGFTNKPLILAMAWVPSLMFIFLELWLKNYLALIPSTAFLIVHTYVAWYSFYI